MKISIPEPQKLVDSYKYIVAGKILSLCARCGRKT